MPTQNGSPIYKDSQPGVDSAVVGICRAAGAIILGKTVCNPGEIADDRQRPPMHLGNTVRRPTIPWIGDIHLEDRLQARQRLLRTFNVTSPWEHRLYVRSRAIVDISSQLMY